MPAVSFGAPTVTVTLPAINVGASGFAALVAVGAPQVLTVTSPLSVQPVGYRVGATLGAPRAVVPTRFAAQAAFGTPGVVLSTSSFALYPAWSAAMAQFGVLGAAVPRSVRASVVFGVPRVATKQRAPDRHRRQDDGLSRAHSDLVRLLERHQRPLRVQQQRQLRQRVRAQQKKLEEAPDDAAYEKAQSKLDALAAMMQYAEAAAATLKPVPQNVKHETQRVVRSADHPYQYQLQDDDEEAMLALA